MTVAFIPVRGGSKSIPLKNIKPLCSKPLVYWTVKAAYECPGIDTVYVCTDSEQIRLAAESFGFGEKVRVIGRSAESASDTASTESVMLEFAANYEFDDIVLIQATSPLLSCADLTGGLELYAREDTDSVLSVVRQYRFIWSEDESGEAHAVNYDVLSRPRRQDFDGWLMENGAFYITSKKALTESKCRMSGRIRAYEMHPDTAFEIDEPSDWVIIESLMRKREQAGMPEIKMVLTDCDGCLTDGGMYYSENGDELKKFNTRDGVAFEQLRKAGIITGIITAESVELNMRRAAKLKLDTIVTGCRDKIAALGEICTGYGIAPENVCYIGDDLGDLGIISGVGFGCCPADAAPPVKRAARYVAQAKGGEGVVREVARIVLGEDI